MTTLKNFINSDALLYSKLVYLADAVIDGRIAATENVIKEDTDFRIIIDRYMYFVKKGNFQAIQKYLINYILNEVVPARREYRRLTYKSVMSDLNRDYRAAGIFSEL